MDESPILWYKTPMQYAAVCASCDTQTRQVGFTTGWRILPWSTVQLVEEGTYRIDHADGSDTLMPGTMWFIPAGFRHRHQVSGKRPVTTTWWHGHITADGVLDLCAGLGALRILPQAGSAPLGQALRAVVSHPASDHLADHLSRQASHLILAAELTRSLGSPVAPRIGNQLLPVFRYITANLSLPLERSELAAQAGLAPSRFHQLFLAMTGVPPMTWVRTQRLARAADLLINTDLGLADIAERSGFYDAYHLNKRFRSAYGKPPSAFRKQARG